MKRFAFLLAILATTAAGQVLDRVVAAINDRVITQSEWEEQARFEALLDGNNPSQIRFDDASLERLIDHVLISEQLQSLKSDGVPDGELKKQADQVRAQLNATDDKIWKSLLQKYGFTEEEFDTKLAQQMNTLQLLDLRFRPNIQVSDRRVEQYYLHTFVPKLQMQGVAADKIPPLKEVEDKIRQVIIEERMNDVMQTWLGSVRSQAKIRKFVSVSKQD
jgi:parvulin-like peptidyl-prolyl isomerase